MRYNDYEVTYDKGGEFSSSLTEQWLQLVQDIHNPFFIHDIHWFQAYLKSHADDAKTCQIIRLHYKKQIIAVFPLQYITKKQYGLELRTWRIFWPNDMGINDFVLREPVNSHNYIKLLSYFLSSDKSSPWDVLELQHVPENGFVADALKNHSLPRTVSVLHGWSKYLACGATYEESVAKVSSKFKRNNRRKRRKLEKLGSVTTTYYDKFDEVKQGFKYFLDIEAANWKGQQKTALLHDEEQRHFYEELINEYANTTQCVIHTLNLDETPIAAQFALISGDTFYLLKIGYNAEYHAMGPGGLLLDETINKFSGNSVIKNISFITGAKWNDDWEPYVNNVYNHYIFNSTSKGLGAWIAEKTKSVMRLIKNKLINN